MTGSKLGCAFRLLTATAAASAIIALLGAADASAATTFTVCPACVTPDYPTIQGAIDAAAASEVPGTIDTISVGPGTYQESIVIPSTLEISIVGSGVGRTTIEADPSTIVGDEFTPSIGPTSYPIIFDDQAPVVSISKLTVDGMDDGNAVASAVSSASATAGPFVGIGEDDSDLTVSDVSITGLADAPPDAVATGEGIHAVNDDSPHTLAVNGSVISDYQQDGIAATGNANLTVDVQNSILDGNGGPANPDGILAQSLPGGAAGPNGEITGNTVSGNISATSENILNDDSVNGAGIRLTDVSGFTVSGNTASNNDVGVWATTAPSETTIVSDNTLEDNSEGGLAGYGANVFSDNTVVASGAQTIGILVAGYEDDPAVANDTVTANTISGANSAIEVAEGNTASTWPPEAAIAYNALFGNTNGVDNDAPSALHAVDNWWGCNGGPGANGCSDILDPGGPVTAAPYLVLGISAAPTSILPGAGSTIVAGIRQDSAGTSFPTGTFPSGPAMTFTTTAGSLASSATLVNGEAALPLSDTPLGSATITGTLDSQSAMTTVTTANGVSTASSTAPSTVTVTVTVPAAVNPLISFLESGSLSLLASNPGSVLTLTCADGCTASVTGTIAVKERKGKRTVHTTLTLASTPLTLTADSADVYTASLTPSQRSTLKRALSATLTLSVTAKDDTSGKTVTGSKTFTLTRT